LDFQGAFFTIAAKEGTSERYHVDWNDGKESITWVIPIGPGWEGGEFCIPQLNAKIPVVSGQVFGAMTRLLAHCSTPITSG
ncbi:hypothetical protein BDN72DRAFT_744869, partial [Pluteus cervinus]